MKVSEYNHYWLQLEFKDDKERDLVVRKTSYELKNAKYSPSFKSKLWDGTKRFLTPANKISRGIFKSLISDHPTVCDPDFETITFRDIPLFENPKYEQRQYQLDAINTILKETRGIVAAIMGAGKTLIAAGTLSYHLKLNTENKALFVCYDRNILDQTIKNFTSYGFNVTQFGDGIKDLSGDIVVATIQSLSRIEDPKNVLKNITFVICDESHHSNSKTSKDVLTKLYNCKYYIGLTATPPKEKTVELAELISVLGPVIFEFGFAHAVEQNKITPVKAFFLDVECDQDIKELVFHRKNYKYIWDTAIKSNDKRNRNIAIILNTLVELLDTSNIVLVDKIEHGAELISHMYKQPKVKAVAMYGEDNIVLRESKKKSLAGDNINTLVSTVITEGVDFAISPVVAVNATGRRGFVKLIQFLGRITRKNEIFGSFRASIDIVDRYHPMLTEHSEARIQACKDFGVDVVVCKSVQELLIEIIKHYKATKNV